jgi:NADH:ubiquinone oxidoreductase subunit K
VVASAAACELPAIWVLEFLFALCGFVLMDSSIPLPWYLLVAAVLFVCGVICMATKRNGIGVLMGVELVLNGANINFVAFSRYTKLGIDGQVISLFVIVLAAAEAAVALAIVLNFYNNHTTIDVDRGDELQG